MKKRVIISTVGTSLFENFKNDGEGCGTDFIRCYDDLKNNRGERWSEDDIERYVKKPVKDFLEQEGEKACAEVSSISKFVSSREGLKKECVTLYFIVSDTDLSLFAAKIISKYLEVDGYNIEGEPEKVAGLSVDKAADFKKTGLPEVASMIHNIIKDDKFKNDTDFYINITGGYKGVLPYMYLIAQMYEIPTFYLYKEQLDNDEPNDENKKKFSRGLIYLPQVPLGFDPLLAEEYYYWLKSGLQGPEKYYDEKLVRELKKLGLVEKDAEGKLKISGMGNVFCNWVFDKAAESPKTIGHLIEYKVFEAFFNAVYHNSEKQKPDERAIKELEESGKAASVIEPKFNGKTIKDVKHGDREILYVESMENVNGKEVDVLLTYTDGSKDFIEVKSLNDFLKSEDVENQFNNRIKRIEAKGIKNATVTFVLYGSLSYIHSVFSAPDKKVEIKKRQEIFEEKSENKNVNVRFKYVEIDREGSKGAYGEFLNKIFTINDIKNFSFK